MQILSKLVENSENYGYLKISNTAVMGTTMKCCEFVTSFTPN